jgi:hypothetical protein
MSEGGGAGTWSKGGGRDGEWPGNCGSRVSQPGSSDSGKSNFLPIWAAAVVQPSWPGWQRPGMGRHCAHFNLIHGIGTHEERWSPLVLVLAEQPAILNPPSPIFFSFGAGY